MKNAPKWALPGGVVLCALAGWANAVGLLGVFHQAITHVTGTATHAAAAAARGDFAAAAVAMSIVVAFGGGAVVAGAIVHGGEVHSGRRYGVALTIEALLWFAAWWLLTRHHQLGEHAAAVAAGLQNGLATRLSGAVVRTTHITGLVTDVGLALGAVLRGRPLETSRVRLQALLIVGFVLGAVGGAAAFAVVGTHALAVPAAICVLLALAAVRLTAPTTVT